MATAVWACGNSGGTDSGSTASTQASAQTEEVDGQKIYKQYCVTCHGLYGDMGASGAYNLTESELSLEERIQIIKNGRKTMTGFQTLLDDEEIEAVAEYTLELKED